MYVFLMFFLRMNSKKPTLHHFCRFLALLSDEGLWWVILSCCACNYLCVRCLWLWYEGWRAFLVSHFNFSIPQILFVLMLCHSEFRGIGLQFLPRNSWLRCLFLFILSKTRVLFLFVLSIFSGLFLFILSKSCIFARRCFVFLQRIE